MRFALVLCLYAMPVFADDQSCLSEEDRVEAIKVMERAADTIYKQQKEIERLRSATNCV